MKKNIFYTIACLLIVITSCDYNKINFDELEDNSKPTNVKNVEYALSDEDYTSVANNSVNEDLAKENGQESELSALKSSKVFTSTLSAANYLPAFLNEKWYTADAGYAAKVTYNFTEDVPEYISELSDAVLYVATNDDYALAWGESGNNYFTPSYPVENYASTILSGNFPDAESGDLKVFSYNYYAGGNIDITTSIHEDFESIAAYENVSLNGWTNFSEAGSEVWEGRSYSSNLYAQCSAYGADGEVVAWLISPSVTLANVENPKLTFDVKFGYYNADCLQVLISDDYNGVDPTKATWSDVTHAFAFYHASSGYTDLFCPGILDLNAYKDKPIYVAFKYVGNSVDATTTVQIDNVQLDLEVSKTSSVAYGEDFANGMDDWANVAVQGDKIWATAAYGGKSYAKISAYGSTVEQEAWLVSPQISVPSANAPQLNFELAIGYYNASGLSVLVSNDYTNDVTTATWNDITDQFHIPTEPASGYSSFSVAGAYSLNDYLGGNVAIAFRYTGNGAENRTTTYEVTEVNVESYTNASLKSMNTSNLKSGSFYTTFHVAYEFDGSEWGMKEGVSMPNSLDYESMGLSYFSSSNDLDSYLKTYLMENYPYGQEDDVMAVAYLYDSETTLGAKEFTFTSGAWVNSYENIEVTEQFVKTDDGFIWDPSVVINLLPVKASEPATTFYQLATDWVWDNVDVAELGVSTKGDGYVTSYANNEYYTGCSAYYNNIDMRPSKALEQYAAGYEGLSDDEIVDLMKERLTVVMGKVLENQYPDATPIEGVDITYTVNVAIYTGDSVSDVNNSLVYKLTGVGTFEYVSGPTEIE